MHRHPPEAGGGPEEPLPRHRAEGVGELDVHRSLLVEAALPPRCAVDELIAHDQVAGRDLAAKRPGGAEGDDVRASGPI
jgi:hypothetical protein